MLRKTTTASGVLRIGHRGAAALGPENSLESMRAALAAGVDGVELDVVFANGRLWVAHSLVELRRASPTLEEALEALSERDVLVVLDVKGVGFEAQVLAALKGRDRIGRTLFASFFPAALRAARALDPDVPTGLSYPHDRIGVGEGRVPEPFLRAGLAGLRRALPLRIAGMLRRAEADTAVLHHLVISAAVVERCRALEAPVFAWTVNDAAALRRVTRLGVDGVITDDPRIFPAGVEQFLDA
jgi:glycerophosphoryl diester phosphodiesterase